VLRSSFLLHGRQMRRAFREVVAEPRQWTVEFLSEDKPVALGTNYTQLRHDKLALKLTEGQDGEAIRSLQKSAREQLAFLEEVGMESVGPESFARFASQLPPELAEHAEELIDAMRGGIDLHEVLERVAARFEESDDLEMFEEEYSEEEYSNETYQRSTARRKQKA
jgi:hypothetical protein